MDLKCKNCGASVNGTDSFCVTCGSPVEKVSAPEQQNGVVEQSSADNTQQTTQAAQTNQTMGTGLIQKREIVKAIIFTFLTCGIYGVYWFYRLTEETNQICDNKSASGGLAILYTVLTCGIYQIYWYYKTGKKIEEAGKKYNRNIEDRSVLYLILGLVGLGIVSYCLIQDELNKFAE